MKPKTFDHSSGLLFSACGAELLNLSTNQEIEHSMAFDDTRELDAFNYLKQKEYHGD